MAPSPAQILALALYLGSLNVGLFFYSSDGSEEQLNILGRIKVNLNNSCLLDVSTRDGIQLIPHIPRPVLLDLARNPDELTAAAVEAIKINGKIRIFKMISDCADNRSSDLNDSRIYHLCKTRLGDEHSFSLVNTKYQAMNLLLKDKNETAGFRKALEIPDADIENFQIRYRNKYCVTACHGQRYRPTALPPAQELVDDPEIIGSHFFRTCDKCYQCIGRQSEDQQPSDTTISIEQVFIILRAGMTTLVLLVIVYRFVRVGICSPVFIHSNVILCSVAALCLSTYIPFEESDTGFKLFCTVDLLFYHLYIVSMLLDQTHRAAYRMIMDSNVVDRPIVSYPSRFEVGQMIANYASAIILFIIQITCICLRIGPSVPIGFNCNSYLGSGLQLVHLVVVVADCCHISVKRNLNVSIRILAPTLSMLFTIGTRFTQDINNKSINFAGYSLIFVSHIVDVLCDKQLNNSANHRPKLTNLESLAKLEFQNRYRAHKRIEVIASHSDKISASLTRDCVELNQMAPPKEAADYRCPADHYESQPDCSLMNADCPLPLPPVESSRNELVTVCSQVVQPSCSMVSATRDFKGADSNRTSLFSPKHLSDRVRSNETADAVEERDEIIIEIDTLRELNSDLLNCRKLHNQ